MCTFWLQLERVQRNREMRNMQHCWFIKYFDERLEFTQDKWPNGLPTFIHARAGSTPQVQDLLQHIWGLLLKGTSSQSCHHNYIYLSIHPRAAGSQWSPNSSLLSSPTAALRPTQAEYQLCLCLWRRQIHLHNLSIICSWSQETQMNKSPPFRPFGITISPVRPVTSEMSSHDS